MFKYILTDKFKELAFNDIAELIEPLIESAQAVPEYIANNNYLKDSETRAKIDQVDFTRPEVHLCVGWDNYKATDSLSEVITDPFADADMAVELAIRPIICFPVTFRDFSMLMPEDTGFAAIRGTGLFNHLNDEFKYIRFSHPNNMFSACETPLRNSWINFTTEAGPEAEPLEWLIISAPLHVTITPDKYKVCD